MSLESEFSCASRENLLSREIRRLCAEELESPIKERFLTNTPIRTSPSNKQRQISPILTRRRREGLGGGNVMNATNSQELVLPLQPHVSPSYDFRLYKAPADPEEILHQLRTMQVPRFGDSVNSKFENSGCEAAEVDISDGDDDDSIPRLMLDVIKFNHQLELYEFRKSMLVDKLEELLELTLSVPKTGHGDNNVRHIHSTEKASNDSDQENMVPVWKNRLSRNNLRYDTNSYCETAFPKGGAIGITPLIPPLRGSLKQHRELSID